MIEDLTRTAAVFTTLRKTELVFYAMSGSEKLGCPCSYDVTLLSENPNIGLSEILGQPICIVLRLPSGRHREFSGFVTRFSFVGGIGRHAAYHVQVEPWLALLRQRVRSRIYQGKTVPAVIEKLFREHGFSDFSNALTARYRTFDYLVQYRESDLQFLLRMMQQEGIYFFFKHHDRKHELVLADSFSAHEAIAGYEKVPYYPPQRNEKRERDYLDQWFVRRGIRPAIYSARDFNFTHPAAPVKSETRVPLDHAFNEYEIYDYPGEFQEKDEADVHTRIRLEEEQASFELVHGEGNARGLQCGALFELEKYPRKDQNKEYLIVEAAYTIQVSNYDSLDDPEVEPEVHVRLVAQDSKTAYRPPRTAKVPTIAGPQTATVVGPSTQEIWTDEYGRVRLQFHWDTEGKRNENSSCWVRVSQAWAGQNWGSIHVPRIGQEVVVSFLEGNPNRPLVTGRVYNADNMPPYDLTKNPTQSGIKSRSTKGGTPDNFNEIRFEDKKGEEELHIQAEKNMTTLVKNDQSTDVLKNRTTTVGVSDTLHVGGNQSITIGSPDQPPRTSKMNVTGKHSLDASDSMAFQAPNEIKFTVGGSTVTITPGGISISSGGGSSVNIDTNVTANSSGKASMKLDANVTAKSQPGSSLKLDANAFIEASGKGSVLVDANVLCKSSSGSKVLVDAASVTMDATKISGTGKAEVGLAAGSGSLKLTPATSALKGAMTNVEGSGMVSIAGPLVKIN
jgi:type VI secretion system secreted protein VgrG